jgi:hypothetical protein
MLKLDLTKGEVFLYSRKYVAVNEKGDPKAFPVKYLKGDDVLKAALRASRPEFEFRAMDREDYDFATNAENMRLTADPRTGRWEAHVRLNNRKKLPKPIKHLDKGARLFSLKGAGAVASTLAVGGVVGGFLGAGKGRALGWDEGRASGRMEGTESGFQAGYNSGEAIGIDKGKKMGFQAGYNSGEAIGINKGKKMGVQEGVSTGNTLN